MPSNNAEFNKGLDGIVALAKRLSQENGKEVHVCELMSYYVSCRPDHAHAWFLFGEALRNLGRGEEAACALNRAFDLAPDHYKGHIAARMALLLEKHDSRRAAEKWYSVAVDYIGIEAGWIWVLRGVNLFLFGDFDQAVNCLRLVVSKGFEEQDEALVNLGIIYRAQGKYHEAIQCLENALALSPEDTEVQSILDSFVGIDETIILLDSVKSLSHLEEK